MNRNRLLFIHFQILPLSMHCKWKKINKSCTQIKQWTSIGVQLWTKSSMYRCSLRISIMTSAIDSDNFVYVGGAGFVIGVGILRVCVTTRRGLWEPTNTKSSGLAGFCAKSGYFRVT